MLLIPQWYAPFSPQQVWMFFQWSMTFQFFIRLNEAESKLKCTILDDWQVFLFLFSHAYEYHGDITPILNEYLHVSIKYSYSCISNIVAKINQRRMILHKNVRKRIPYNQFEVCSISVLLKTFMHNIVYI